jgi:serine protein kinase
MDTAVLKMPSRAWPNDLDSDIEKVVVNGKTTYDFSIFSTGKKHIIGMYDEINSFVSYVKDAAENGSSKEMAFVLVGEPGNGKTFLVDFVCNKYRNFLSREAIASIPSGSGLDKIGGYGKITTIESQTYEDPMILGMNITEEPPAKTGSFCPRRSAFRTTKSKTLRIIARWVPAVASYGTISELYRR